MQWSLVLFSLKDSPPDGLSHTLWRTGGERGGESKKAGKLSAAEKEKVSLDLIDKDLSAVSEYNQ